MPTSKETVAVRGVAKAAPPPGNTPLPAVRQRLYHWRAEAVNTAANFCQRHYR